VSPWPGGGAPRYDGPSTRSKAALIAILLLAAVLPFAYGGRQSGLTPEAGAVSDTPVLILDLRFVEEEDTTLRVVAADGEGDVLRVLPPGEGGFMRGVMRPLRRERMRMEVPYGDPYRLARRADGSLTLSDPGANLVLELAAFGATSVAAFASLLDEYGAPPSGSP